MSFLLKLDRYAIALLATVLVSLIINISFPRKNLKESFISEGYRDHKETFADDLLIDQVQNSLNNRLVDAEVLESNIPTDSNIEKKGNSYSILLEYGDTFSKILRDIGFSLSNAHLLSSSINKVYDLSKLKSGDQVNISLQYKAIDNKDMLLDGPEKIVIDFRDVRIFSEYSYSRKTFDSKLIPMDLITKIAKFSGKITSNFISAAIENGASSAIAMDFVNIFSQVVDFQRDLSHGNKFEILYESKNDASGKKVKDGRIIYSSLEVKGKKIELYFHEDADGTGGYFHKDGSNVRNMLLKTPVKASRISSHYGMRKHPILGYSKMHKGLDYAAPKGTPVAAAGDGIVEIVRYHKGYGRYIKIKHNEKYSTLYAHLDKFAKKLRPGKRVFQGDIIGYIGSTGLSTGPHLHYEVHENGIQVNPAKINKNINLAKLKGPSLIAFRNNQYKIDELLADATLVSMSNSIIKSSKVYAE